MRKRCHDRFNYTHPRHWGCIDLSLNENPYGPSPNVSMVLENHLEELSVYPDDELYRLLRYKIADVFGMQPENVVLTDAGMGAIDLIFSAIQFDRVYIQKPTFDPIIHRVVYYGGKVVDKQSNADVCVFLNPNNPTGLQPSRGDIMRALENDTLVIVDEEYVGFSEWNMLPEIRENLIVTRSFSKEFGLASMRIGWITTTKTIAEYLRDVRYPWRVGRMSCIAAEAALDDMEYVQKIVKKTIQIREDVQKRLEDRLQYIPSQANYILALVGNAEKVHAKLLERKYVVRNMTHRTGYNSIRFTVHKEVIMKEFVDKLLEVI